ncbi:hypothetical protein Plhal304r1_c035g0109221 [Plasmopara halstedii]
MCALTRRDKKEAVVKASLYQLKPRAARNGDGRYENSRNGNCGRRNGNGNGGHGAWKNYAARSSGDRFNDHCHGCGKYPQATRLYPAEAGQW